MTNFYPVMDRLTAEEATKLGLDHIPFYSPSLGLGAGMGVKAVSTGEKRKPKKGEWYLSGAIVEAYRAPNDFDTVYWIARLVRTITTTETKIIAST